jgi:endo-1,4-beta-xylanase
MKKKLVPGFFLPVCAGILLVAIAEPTIIRTTPRPTLRAAADHAGILVGTAVRPWLFSEAAYSRTLGREFNLVEPEDAMKWAIVRPTADAFVFGKGDEVVRFAQAHGMKVRGHCLVWDHGNPDWLTKGNFTPAQMSHVLQEHITAEMKHFAGQVFAWDVVNEALDENGRLKDSPWYNHPGIGLADKNTAYVEQAFRWAHETDANALLFYNENGGEGLGQKSDAIYAMVKDFKQRGVPIDGVGLQMHIFNLDFDTKAVADNIARLTALGLQVHITELDVSLPLNSTGGASDNDLQKQAEIYRGVVRACLQNPGCTAIQTWGFTDKYSWIGSHSHGTRGAALPLDHNYQPKPAYEAMRTELAGKNSKP